MTQPMFKMPDRFVIVSGNLFNIGDLVLCQQSIALVRGIAPSAQILVRQWGLESATIADRLAGLRCELLNSRNPLSSIRAGIGAFVLIGGGQMIRENASMASMLSLAAMVTAAKATGGHFGVIGCGLSTLRPGRKRQLWQHILRHADLIVVREASSLKNARDLIGDSDRIHLASDLALVPTSLEAKLSPTQKQSLIVAPCLDKSEARDLAIDDVAKLTVQIARREGLRRIQVLAHDIRPEMDLPVCAAVKAAVEQIEPALVVETLATTDPDDYFTAYSAAKVVITNRLHPMLFAIQADAKVLVLNDGNPKTAAFAKTFGLASLTVKDACDAAQLEALLSSTEWNDLSHMRNVLAMKREDAKRNEALLRGLIAS